MLAVVRLSNAFTKVLLTKVQVLCGCSTNAHTSVLVIGCPVPPRATEVLWTIKVDPFVHLVETILAILCCYGGV